MVGKLIDWINRLIDVRGWFLYILAAAGITGASGMAFAVSLVSWAKPYAPIIIVLLIPFAAVLFSYGAALVLNIFLKRRDIELQQAATDALQLAGRIDRKLSNIAYGIVKPDTIEPIILSAKAMRDKFHRLGFPVPMNTHSDPLKAMKHLSQYFRLVGYQIQHGNHAAAMEDARKSADFKEC